MNSIASHSFLTPGSDMARRIRAHDWSPSLGAIEQWPTSLRTTVGLMLHSPVPLVLLWGQQGIMIYNDAYGVFAGGRHPGLLGMPVLDGWPEAADLNRHVMQTCMAGGSLQYDDHELMLDRRGRPETLWVDLFYSPVIAEDGQPGGAIAVVVETTDRVLARREALAQKDRLAQMFEDAPSFMAQLEGPDHVFAVANTAYRQLVAPRDVIGRPVREALPEIAAQGFGDLLDEVYRSGESFRGHALPISIQRRPDGPPDELVLDFIYQPLRGADGAVTGIFVEGTDVTERERATAAVRDNARRLAFLDGLSRATAHRHDADDILRVTTRLLGEHLAVSICAYADMDADEDGFTIRGDWCAPGSRSIVGHYRLADFGRRATTELGAGRPLVVNDAVRELPSSEAAAFQAIGIGATLCMPLVKEGRLTALMAVHRRHPHRWRPEELALLREVTERSWAHVERVRDEAARFDSAERLRLAAGAANIGTFDYDLRSGALRWDARCKALFGLPADAAVDYDVFLAGLHPDDRARIDDAVRRALDPQRREDFDVEYRTVGLRDGVQRWVAATGDAFFEHGAATRFVGAVHDISAQKIAEAQLRASETQFRTMAQAMPNHVWTSLPDGRLDWFNDQAYAYTGAVPGTLDAEGWARIVHAEDRAEAARRWHLAIEGGGTYETQYRLRRADGTWRWHLARAVPVRDEAGAVSRWIGTNTDIQDEKDLNERLEQRVAERTGQLRETEEALRQAQKMEAVGQLTGGLAHDFNNILQGIVGAVERARHRIAGGRPADAERFLKAAMDSSARAAALTHRLLAFSRRQTLDPRPLDANRLIAGMAELIDRTMGPTIAVEVVPAPDLWPIRADASQLENALLNLCINARDAMPDGGRLSIVTANAALDAETARALELDAGDYVVLRVTDTGTGMSADVVERAFDPFFTTKPIGRGTGLGLSMIYGFARQSGGQIRIDSEPGQGTTMSLHFPRHLGAAEPRPAPAPPDPLARGLGESVLVVDDDAAVRALVVETLAESRYDVIEAADAPSALPILRTMRPIALLITDVGLPGGMNGRQLADAARQLRPDLRVLFITGYAEHAIVGTDHLEPGMAILAKPFALGTLAKTVRDMLDARATTAP